MMKKRTIGKYDLCLFTPETQTDTIIYIHLDEARALEIWDRLSEPKPVLAAIGGADWNRDLSPWSAERVFKNGEDFTGGGREHLDFILNSVIPEAEVDFSPKKRVVAGYSLGGLFALWASFQTDAFDYVMTASGSMWFDGFLDYINSHTPQKAERVYFSLGDREKKTGNPRMKTIEDATLTAVETMKNYGAKTFFEFNTGGHFDNVPDRIARGINRLISEENLWK